MSKVKISNWVEAIKTILVEVEADYTAYGKLEDVKKSVHMNEARLDNLEKSFKEARALHQKIVAAPSEEAKIEYMNELTFHSLKERYYSYSSELREQLTGKDSQNHTQGFLNSSVAGPKMPSVEIKLPPIQIPTFDGSLQLWPEFKGLFESLVNKNTSISDAHKLHYLKNNLSGDARRLLRNTDSNFEAAWALLVKRFQNLRLLKDNQFRLLFDQPKLNQESAGDIKLLLDTTNEAKQSLENLGVPVKSWEDILIFHTVKKLPFTTRGLWETHISSYADYPRYSILEDFLLTRSRTLEVMGQHSSGLHQPRSKKSVSETVRSHNSTVSKCAMCQGLHSIRNCFKFKALNPKKRQDMVRNKKLCFNCLSNAHFTNNCTSTFTCSTCHQKHHSLLHLNDPAQAMHAHDSASSHAVSNPATHSSSSIQHTQSVSADSPTSSTSITNSHSTFTAEHSHNQTVLLATALVKVFTTAGQPLLLRALLDPGSEASFISESAAQQLNLKRERSYVNIVGVGETNTGTAKHKVSLTIFSPLNENFSVHLNAMVLPKLTAVLPAQYISGANWSHLQSIELADPSFNKPSKIDILLGCDVYPSIILEGIVKGDAGTPMAQRTELGWVLSGCTATTQHSTVTSLHIKTEGSNLDNILQRFWELEEVARRKMLSLDEQKCETHFCRTHQRQPDGRYVVELPFKEGSRPGLGLSHRSALLRFFQLERKFRTNTLFYEEYKKVFTEYKELGHMTEVDPTSLTTSHYFVPHHAVMKESSSTTKLRIVFDASCKTSDGTSLNDHLLVGARLQDDIFDHIARMRRHKIAFVADITKMYRQIWVSSEDSAYQLILWRDIEGGEVKTYRLNTVTFGTAAAPYLAIRTLQQLAADERDDYPIAARIACNNFYVDDVIHGAESEDKAIEMQQQLLEMLKHGGFPLRKWVSNSEKLLASVPEEDREVQVPLSFDEGNSIKALGIQWHPGRDVFSFKISLQDTTKTTKRTILSDIARLYDPMGWISPCVLLGKVLMQEIWKGNQMWDQELPQTIITAWHKLKTELIALNVIKIPRWVHVTKNSSIEIHGFCDASEKAYAAAVYIRTTTRGITITNLLVSKTRVAPLKNKSLPRLELCGAQLLAHLLVHTVKTMELESARIFAWCDSQITLAWIRSPPYIRTTFVANRVAEIQELTDATSWNYVPSKDNPADVASRGLSPRDLPNNHQWWHGPEFLQTFDGQSHSNSQIDPTNLELKSSLSSTATNMFLASGYPIKNIFQLCVHFIAVEPNQLFTRFSSLNRLLRATAYWLRFFKNLRSRAQKQSGYFSGPLSVDEISAALMRLFIIVQKDVFAEELAKLERGENVSKGSKLARLSPIIDDNGMLRVGGRLENANLPYSQRHPIILPSQTFLTSLIIHDIHMRSLHGGQQLMMATLRTKYWVLHLKSSVKACIHKCLKCYRHKATQMEQKMGNLPAVRVSQGRPFQSTGVDYAGPVQLKAWKGRCNKISKAYIAIFICFCTKAVHLELVSDYTTSAFLAAFKRFIARRGICTNIYSDCGTNFQGAAKILESERSHMSKQWTEDIALKLQEIGTSWHFNPPSAPHFGGLWEAGVKSMKYHLKRIIGHYTLTFEEYATVLVQVEACLNSRPLCPVSEDPEDLSILTPGHFLIGAPLNTAPERDLTERKTNYLERWQLMQRILQDFWRRWKSEYLSRLMQRPKWLSANANLEVGHLVLLADEQTPPTLWRLGRITATHPGNDGRVRVVTIKTATNTLKRPIAKLCLLPMLNEQNIPTNTPQ